MSTYDISALVATDPEVSGVIAGSPDVTTQGNATFCGGGCVTEADLIAIGLVDSVPSDAGLVALLDVRHAALIAA